MKKNKDRKAFVNLQYGDRHVTSDQRRRLCNANRDHAEVDGSEATTECDGKLYSKQRDPPGQKSQYLYPSDTTKEVYRMTTFMKFPDHIPVDVVLLARCGFYYTGYKDRVKCFSCGIAVYDWLLSDDPTSTAWHLKDCAMVMGTEQRNQPIQIYAYRNPDPFKRVTSTSLSDTGYYSGCSSSTTQQLEQSLPSNELIGTPTKQPSVPVMTLTNTIQNLNITSEKQSNETTTNNNYTFQQNSASHFYQSFQFASIVSAEISRFLISIDIRKEDDRRTSFRNWPREYASISLFALAKSGFFYLGNLDRTQCFSCGGVLRNWSANENVNSEHLRHFAHCKMANGIEPQNVPSASPPLINEPPDPSAEEMRKLERVFKLDNPISPHMKNYEMRLQTFDRRWPRHKVNATVEQIAKAGFFFLGERDRAKCWYCNGGLQNWDPNDEPWTEHAKWFPGCQFVMRQKGVRFVRELFARNPNLNRPGIRNASDHYQPGVFERVVSQLAENSASRPPASMSAGQVLTSLSSVHRAARSATGASNNVATRGLENEIERLMELGFTREQIEQTYFRLQSDGNSVTPEAVIEVLLASNNKTRSQPTNSRCAPQVTSLPRVNQPGLAADNADACNPENSLKRKDVFNSSEQACSSKEQRPTKIVRRGEEGTLTELEKQRNCKSCLAKTADIMVTNCGHIALCEPCSKTTKRCVVCSVKIESFLKTFRA